MSFFRRVSLLSFIFFSSITFAKGLPFYPQEVKVLGANEESDLGQKRVKISLANDGLLSKRGVTIGNVTLCSETTCYRPVMEHKTVELVSTAEGKSADFVHLSIPYTTIKTVHFESIAGTATLAGDLELNPPVEVTKDIPGMDVFIVLKEQREGQTSTYLPIASNAHLYRLPFSKEDSSLQYVYYNPTVKTTAHLNRGASISLPENATVGPQIFSVAMHNAGKKYPLIDIFPEIVVLREFSLSIMPTVRDVDKNIAVDPAAKEFDGQIIKVFQKTGVINISEGPASATDDLSSRRVDASEAATSCASYLSSNLQSIISASNSTGAVYIDYCENISPYVHIALANLMDHRELFSLAYTSAGSDALYLSYITSWKANSQIMVNGFTWAGDTGIAGGEGHALGYAYSATTCWGNNSPGGGCHGPGGDGNKLVLLQTPQAPPIWKEGSGYPLFSNPAPGGAIFSSSTSIVKSGICSGDSLNKPWSALGTSSNRMVILSSASGKTSTAAQLCPIVQALGVNNAIRLDGGPSAAILIDGILLNPLTGSDFLIYGTSRHIAYAAKIGYFSGTSAKTPTFSNNGRIPGPTDPCKTNPASCR